MLLTGERGNNHVHALRAIRIIVICAVLVSTLALIHSPANGETGSPADEAGNPTSNYILIQADLLTYSDAGMVVTAEGHVELTHDRHTILADRLVYSRHTGIAQASGNVRILEPQGNVVFADEIELDEDLNSGLVLMPAVLLSDNARLAATRGVLSENGTLRTLHKAAYSPCQICRAEGSQAGAPLWQIKARKIVHDTQAQTIRYENARIEFFGVPVVWLPLLVQPDPLVEKKTGFLTPDFGTSTDLGTYVETPWFWNLAPHYDLTIAPKYYSKSGLLVQNEWRHRLQSGTYSAQASGILTQTPSARGPNNKKFRGALFGQGQFTIKPDMRWGFGLETTTDDTFLRRFDITDRTELVSRLFWETQPDLNYGSVNAYHFQDLLDRTRQQSIPVIIPIADYRYLWPEPVQGGLMTLDGNLMVLSRNQGVNSRRLSTALTWTRQFYDPAGSAWRMLTQIRGDVYNVSNLLDEGGQTAAGSHDRWVTRFLPTAGLEWRFPLIRGHAGNGQIIEPVVQLFVAPRRQDAGKIPNEDSRSLELDDTNLFARNRSAGLDRWEGGTRANVGVRMTFLGDDNRRARLVFGQVYRTRVERSLAGNSGVSDRRSDYVGLVSLSPGPWLSLEQRFRLDRDDLSFRRNDISLDSRLGILRFGAGYVKLSGDLPSDTETNKEARLYFSADIHRYWQVYGSWRRNLTIDKTVRSNVGIRYNDECFSITMALQQDFTRDRDIEGARNLYIQFTLKTLGGSRFTTSLDEEGGVDF